MISHKSSVLYYRLSLFWILYACELEVSALSCPLPPYIKSSFDYDWQSRKNEWSNTNSKTDYFVFSLSWSPTFCASLPDDVRATEFQCERNDVFGLVVHGLWPQRAGALSVRDHPRNCRNEQQLSVSTIKRFYCLLPDENLLQAEWEKHGSCYYKTAEDYFQTIEYLFYQLNLPNLRTMRQPKPSSIKDTFLALNFPNLFSSAIRIIIDREGRLDEIRICYDLRYRFISCYQ